ncbi:polysaccharide deacetylase family protein [Zavarzinella formosa]|uniref:polysaccharide deacetylase family protein n=1 Tax=Zavarzinella formosa TaxID=360055 RepID=UPI000310613C|nr:polysaccharide deacetylase family protein [Zavarzinella formosa]
MSRSPQLTASLSLDLDNKWSYMKTHGDAGWEELPSYLSIIVPRVLDLLDQLSLKITWFIVGLDAAKAADRTVLGDITRRGHEVGNHSFRHEPWLHLYSDGEIEEELSKTEDALEEVTGQRPIGFRGPGFSLSPAVLRILANRHYLYDASTFPTFLGPLARMYYFAKAGKMTAAEKHQRSKLFGKLSEGFKRLNAYRWHTPAGPIVEIPVTTFPMAKIPIHLSYLLYLSCYSPLIARWYFRAFILACKITRTQPSLLLHPLDFMGNDDVSGLDFFPAMKIPGKVKLGWAADFLRMYAKNFKVLPMSLHVKEIIEKGNRLPARTTEK